MILLLVVENVLCKVFEHILWCVRHTVLCELCSSQSLCLCLCLVSRNSEFLRLDYAALDIVPSEHFEERLEILLDILHCELALVDGVQPTLQELGRHCKVSLLHQEVANCKSEHIVALTLQFRNNLLVNISVELLLVCNITLWECHLEELLVQLRVCKLANLGNLQREVRVDTLQLLLLNAKDRGTLCRVLVQLVYIDLGLVADLLADKWLALLVRHRDKTYISLLDTQIAIVESYIQCLVLLHLVNILQRAVAAEVVVEERCVHLLVNLDFVVGNLILCSECHIVLWSYTILEYELVSCVVVEVEVALLLGRNYIADIVNLLCLQILECSV